MAKPSVVACGVLDCGTQLECWLKALNILRNYSAHHVRLFTRVFDIKPKIIDDPRMLSVEHVLHRVFGHMSLIWYLNAALGTGNGAPDLACVLESYSPNRRVSFQRTGVPGNWRELALGCKRIFRWVNSPEQRHRDSRATRSRAQKWRGVAGGVDEDEAQEYRKTLSGKRSFDLLICAECVMIPVAAIFDRLIRVGVSQRGGGVLRADVDGLAVNDGAQVAEVRVGVQVQIAAHVKPPS